MGGAFQFFRKKNFSSKYTSFLACYSSGEKSFKDPYRLWKLDQGEIASPFKILIFSDDEKEKEDCQKEKNCFLLKTNKGEFYKRGQISDEAGTLALFLENPKEKENPEKFLVDLFSWQKENSSKKVSLEVSSFLIPSFFEKDFFFQRKAFSFKRESQKDYLLVSELSFFKPKIKIKDDKIYLVFVKENNLYLSIIDKIDSSFNEIQLAQDLCLDEFSFDFTEKDEIFFAFFSENKNGKCTLKLSKFKEKTSEVEVVKDLRISPFEDDSKQDLLSFLDEEDENKKIKEYPLFDYTFLLNYEFLVNKIDLIFFNETPYILLYEYEENEKNSKDLLLLYPKDEEWFFKIFHFVEFFKAKKKDNKVYLLIFDPLIFGLPSFQKEEKFYLIGNFTQKEEISSLENIKPIISNFAFDFQKENFLFGANFFEESANFYFLLFNKKEKIFSSKEHLENPSLLLNSFFFKDEILIFYQTVKKNPFDKENPHLVNFFFQNQKEPLFFQEGEKISFLFFKENSFLIFDQTFPIKVYFINLSQ